MVFILHNTGLFSCCFTWIFEAVLFPCFEFLNWLIEKLGFFALFGWDYWFVFFWESPLWWRFSYRIIFAVVRLPFIVFKLWFSFSQWVFVPITFEFVSSILHFLVSLPAGGKGWIWRTKISMINLNTLNKNFDYTLIFCFLIPYP